MAKMKAQQVMGFEISISGHNDGTLEAAYITVRYGKAVKTKEIVEDILLADYDSRGRLIGLEVLAPVRLSKLTPLVEEARRKPFRIFIKKQAPRELVLS